MNRNWRTPLLLVIGLALGLALGLAWQAHAAGLASAPGQWSMRPDAALRRAAAPQLLAAPQLVAAPQLLAAPTPNALANQAAGNGPNSPQVSPGWPTGQMSYQGSLVYNGAPYNGTINLGFRLYEAVTGSGSFWVETQTVNVQNGLFNVMLGAVNPLAPDSVSFQYQLYLGIQPQGAAELAPREPLGAVAYALNLMPGATMQDVNPPSSYVYSFWVDGNSHDGIYGGTTYTGTLGVRGHASGAGGAGVLGSTSGGNTNTCSSNPDHSYCGAGVVGQGNGTFQPGGYFYSQQFVTLWAHNVNTSYWGILDESQSPSGIHTTGNLKVDGNLTVAGSKTGYVVDIALNAGTEPLEQGDVVVIIGASAPVIGQIPVVTVEKAGESGATDVMGVVDQLYRPCADPAAQLDPAKICGGYDPGAKQIAPGQYLSVVTLGAFGHLKVNAAAAPIHAGDLLGLAAPSGGPGTTGPAALNGIAMKAATTTVNGITLYAPGTIVGHALASLDSGQGDIPVFVSAR